MIPIKIELPDDFLFDEERNGYLVTRKMKEVWAIELDLLNKFLQVCKKYNLEYLFTFFINFSFIFPSISVS